MIWKTSDSPEENVPGHIHDNEIASATPYAGPEHGLGEKKNDKFQWQAQ